MEWNSNTDAYILGRSVLEPDQSMGTKQIILYEIQIHITQ